MDKEKTLTRSVEIDGEWYEIPNYRPARVSLTEALEIFEDNLDDIKDAAQRNIVHVTLDNPKPEPTGWETFDEIREDLRKLIVERDTAGYRKTLERIKAIEYHRRHHRPGKITDVDIERAREYPIESLYDGELRRSARKQTGLCPFHDERTPSFYIHEDNRWSCFGCNSHGDAIDYYMRLHGVDFISAIKSMINK